MLVQINSLHIFLRSSVSSSICIKEILLILRHILQQKAFEVKTLIFQINT